MKRFSVILIVLILASCSPQKRLGRLLERFPPDTLVRIEHRDTTIYKDSTVYLEIPGKDSVVEVPLSYNEVFAHTDYAWARAYIEDTTLGLELHQKDTLIKFVLDSVIVNHHDTTFIKQTVLVDKPIPPKPFWKIGFLITGILLILIIALLILRK